MNCQASDADLAALQGSWAQVGFEADGTSAALDEYDADGAITTFAENHFSVRNAKGLLFLEGAFELDAACAPKTVNWIDAIGPDQGKILPAIYRLEGHHFVFVAAQEGAPRPTVFRTTMGQTMRTFVRQDRLSNIRA
jgi:uncharacterized protein (TIGR03067 family)